MKQREGIHQIVVRMPVSLHAQLEKATAKADPKLSVNAAVIIAVEQLLAKNAPFSET